MSVDFLGGVLNLDTIALILLQEILDSITLGTRALNEIQYILQLNIFVKEHQNVRMNE